MNRVQYLHCVEKKYERWKKKHQRILQLTHTAILQTPLHALTQHHRCSGQTEKEIRIKIAQIRHRHRAMVVGEL